MNLNPQAKLVYLITSGQTTPQTNRTSKEFTRILRLIDSAVAAQVDLIQIREKQLTGRALYALTAEAVQIARGSSTKLLVNDRADIAAGAGAHGVHLSTRSLEPHIIRATFGDDFLIGVSTHSEAEAALARTQGADFAVLGPVFETSSKRQYGPPLGLEGFQRIASTLFPFPILALGGVTISSVGQCMAAGASGIAGISMFNEPAEVGRVVNEVRSRFP